MLRSVRPSVRLSPSRFSGTLLFADSNAFDRGQHCTVGYAGVQMLSAGRRHIASPRDTLSASFEGTVLGEQRLVGGRPWLCTAAASLCIISCIASLYTIALIAVSRHLDVPSQPRSRTCQHHYNPHPTFLGTP